MAEILDSNKYGAIGEYIKENTKPHSEINIASPIFTIYAFQELIGILKDCDKFRFLFNEPTFLDPEVDEREYKEFVIQVKERESSVSEYQYELGLKNRLNQTVTASQAYKFIEEKAEVKSVTKPKIISTSNICVKNANNKGFLIGGGNISFSQEGLGYSDEVRFDFNSADDDPAILAKYETFYNRIFNDARLVKDVKDELLKRLTELYKENSPELLYYVTLYKIFSDQLVNDDDRSRIKEQTGITGTIVWNSLYNFQHDAVVGAIKKLEKYNGCIIADSVGLGKTFEALAIIKYYELRNDRVLVLAPKKLRGNWTAFRENSTTNMLANDRFNYDVLNHTDLSREKGKSGDINLETINWGNYDLLVIDESHNFRNNNVVVGKMTRYQKLMQNIIKSGVKTKVLLLSATPVNTRLADLKNQLMFITEDHDDAFKESAGINSIENTLNQAQKAFNDWAETSGDDKSVMNLLPKLDYNFFNLLNTVTIARSRKHIQTYYDTKDIGEFPERMKPLSIRSDIDKKGKFPTLEEANGSIAKLHLAIYSPMLYILPTRKKYYEDKYDKDVKEGAGRFKQADRERSIVNLMRVNILKRLESSVNSFSLTVERILTQVDTMLDALAKGKDFSVDNIDEVDDEFEDFEIGGKIKVKVEDLDKLRMKQDLLEDKKTLESLLKAAKAVTPDRDAKLHDLKKQILEKIQNPINNENKKVIIFTTFSDTADYLYDNISDWAGKECGLKTGLVTGGDISTNLPHITRSFESVLAHFSPRSNHLDPNKEQIDILIATDCISEGQNLQDCDYLINYDIHWNPVRIIQRFGRIDRIGSTNKYIQLVNFWPNMELDEYIKLENRVKSRMVMLDISATGEDDVLSTEGKNLEYRKRQLEQLQNEVLDFEDLQGGISITDLTLDDFVAALQRYMEEHPDVLEHYPTGIYAVTDINEKVKDECKPGVIYCLKQKRYAGKKESASSLYPYYLVYVEKDGNIHISNSSPKKILDLYKALCQGKDEINKSLVKKFNKETNDGNDMSKYTELLRSAIGDIKGAVEQVGVQSLFQRGKATLFDNMASSIDDFELISFLVVK